ncbi:hypothetical protein OHA77_23635 [Streptosporangium sp. NBC_01639]|uniref:hypothetical protein n=1 Tax=Streptosporangium sp. NBC_01639 TaxID=2975948 RepID=UPI00386B0AB4|nr:hypothetical protein OHA77_23635 [Streptosporangium sp. NBC_01639]
MSVPRTPTTTTTTAAPSVHHRALLTWLAVYSMITVTQLLLGGLIAALPLPVRTLILTGVVVPVVVYVLVPALLRVHTEVRRRPAGATR